MDKPATVAAPDGKVYDVPILTYEYNGKNIWIQRHPMLFISTDVTAWYDSYEAVTNGFFEKGRYEEQSPLWMDCYRIYTKYYNKFYKKVTGKNGS